MPSARSPRQSAPTQRGSEADTTGPPTTPDSELGSPEEENDALADPVYALCCQNWLDDGEAHAGRSWLGYFPDRADRPLAWERLP